MPETPTEVRPADQGLASAAISTNGLDTSPTSLKPDDVDRLVGVVALPRRREILFSDEVELDVRMLPRWRPHISVDERRLTDDDDE